MKEEIYRCDYCNAPKGQANHWYAVRIVQAGNEGVVEIRSFEFAKKAESFTEKPIPANSWSHYCGRECMFKGISVVLP